MDSSNTTEKLRGGVTGRGFVAGDPRINRRGRPKKFDTLRREAIKIAGELDDSPDSEGGMTRIHAILLDWATSKDVRKQQLFMEYAFGKVPNPEQHSGVLKVETWQSEVIVLLRSGQITTEDVRRELGDELARPVLLAAHVADLTGSS